MNATLRWLGGVAAIGLVATLVYVVHDSAPAVVHGGSEESGPKAPFTDYIAATGLVEPDGGVVELGTPVSGVVDRVQVIAGQTVHSGDLIFQVDASALTAKLPVLRAEQAKAEADLRAPKHQLEHALRLIARDPHAMSEEGLELLRDAVAQGQAELDLASAKVTELEQDIARYSVKAPSDGQILQSHVRPGMFIEASGTGSNPSLLLMGDMAEPTVRVAIDEHDVGRFRTQAQAVAQLPGSPGTRYPLTYLYSEPLMMPKTVTSGTVTERIDTHVLLAHYRLPPAAANLHPNQRMRVFIDTSAGASH